MIFFDAIAWIVIANIAVYLAEDLSSAIRGKRSPRRQARDERRKEGISTPADRSRSAIGGYLSGLLEDATASAKKSRRIRAAKRQGKKAVGGVFVDFDQDISRYYADCDICGWISQPYRIEENARNAGAEHSTIHDPIEDASGDSDEDSGWTPRVIDGGKEERPERPERPERTARTERPERPERPEWRPSQKTPRPAEACEYPVGDGVCGGTIHEDANDPTVPAPTGNKNCRYHTAVEQGLIPKENARLYGWVCNRCGQGQENYISQQAAEKAANSHKCNVNDDLNIKFEQPKEEKVNFEGTGATAIYDAIGDTASELHDKYEEFDSIAATLADAADNYESRGMADSTVTLIREAADAATSAATQIQTAAEHMDSALADFQATDGKVAEAAQEAGNVADESILLD